MPSSTIVLYESRKSTRRSTMTIISSYYITKVTTTAFNLVVVAIILGLLLLSVDDCSGWTTSSVVGRSSTTATTTSSSSSRSRPRIGTTASHLELSASTSAATTTITTNDEPLLLHLLLLDQAREREQCGELNEAIALLTEFLHTRIITRPEENAVAAAAAAQAEAYTQLGNAYRKTQQFLEAAQSLERAMDLLLSIESIMTDDDDQQHQSTSITAQRSKQHAERINKKDQIQFDLGCIYSTIGYVSEAVNAYQQVLHTAEKEEALQSQARIRLANVLLDGCGQREEALKVYSSFGKESPLAVMTGVVLDSMGRHEDAMLWYESARNKFPGDIEAGLHLMMSLMMRKSTTTTTTTNTSAEPRKDKDKIEELRSKLPAYMASSAMYVAGTSVGFLPSTHYFCYDMLKLGLNAASSSSSSSSSSTTSTVEGGLILEFGVYHGKTIRMTAEHFPDDPIHGFDTFSGIPEDWHNTKRGSYSTHGSLPPAPENVQYHVGLFSDTLPLFLEEQQQQQQHQQQHQSNIKFMNIDCDLYSSTKDIFDAVHERVVPGTVIVFDEYVMNPNWKEDEYKAFQEAVKSYGWTYEYLGISLVSQQAVVRILSVA